MGERKVLNKYYPPDFDPSKLPKGKRVRSEEKQMKVRMMLPMSVRCNTCGTFMYKGTKFNTRMEDVKGENYLGIKIFRFYYRCTHCSAEFCMKTDPQTADYVVEAGATRNYEPWRDKEKTKVETVAAREEEERGNAMKALENRTLDSKREMDILSALDEMKSLKARHATIDTETALAALKRSAAQQAMDLDAEDEAAVRQMLLQRAGFVRRLSDSDEEGQPGGSGPGPFSAGASAAGALGAAAAGAVEDVPAAAAAGAAGGEERRGKRKLGARGGLAGPSVAAAAWEDDGGGAEEEAQESEQGRGEGDVSATAAGQGAGSASAAAGVGAAAPPSHVPAGAAMQPAAAGPAGSAPAAKPKPPPPAAAAQQPPPLPGFAVRARPVAVVVKRKVEPAAVGAVQQHQQQQASGQGGGGGSDSSGGGGALAGLMGYGSGTGSESE